ncbi:MAG: NnrS family protein [Methylotenera sp.]|uniref:NnrS family protein n=1 Tax=Methylotenera sp. TaxID=2051956 RepID=UPI0017C5A987|nr:NnrS family protein [Methylotenera sp.]NOU24427.1 NnrS family protein [Methylotenera sp.]
MQIQMNKPSQKSTQKFALFNLGFRPFFLGASIFAIFSIFAWMLAYFSFSKVIVTNISLSQWHAHEMLYGYGMAVVAGFLLTAVKNWTGIATLHGKPLMVLFLLWCSARLLFLFGTDFLAWAAVADLLFGLMLIVAIAIPIVKAKQWIQLAVVSKIILLWVGNWLFYLGCFGVISSGMLYAINGAVLLFISLILMIGRRVIPFFIERGVDYKIQLKQYKWLDISILVVFLALFLNVIFIQNAAVTTLSAGILFTLNGYRLYNWHTVGLWRVPLLWSLYLSAWLINLGFLCYGLQALWSHLPVLTLHIFTVGGIGLMTLSMMSRVALGHTGRDVRKPSRWLSLAFAGMLASVIFRAVLPMALSQYYVNWVFIASVFWIVSFAIFVVIYAPILLKPRADGTYG